MSKLKHDNLACTVLQPGPFMSLQGLPRTAVRSLGFPAGGAVVPYCHALANILVGNSPSAPVLEIAQAALLQTHQPIVMACTGDASVEIEGFLFPAGKPLFIPSGARVRIIGKAFSYCAMKGTIKTRSFRDDSSISASESIRFLKNDSIYIEQENYSHVRVDNNNVVQAPLWRAYALSPCTLQKNNNGKHIIRYIPYPISAISQHEITSEHTVSTLNRQGIRLIADMSEIHVQSMLPSFPVLPGTIQIPPDGNPIILLADAQPTGGYPVLGTVIKTDFSILSTLVPGTPVQLLPVSLSKARELALQEQRLLSVYQKTIQLFYKEKP